MLLLCFIDVVIVVGIVICFVGIVMIITFY
jgi:hypothetical protein